MSISPSVSILKWHDDWMTGWPDDWMTGWLDDQITEWLEWADDHMTGNFADDWPYGIFKYLYNAAQAMRTNVLQSTSRNVPLWMNSNAPPSMSSNVEVWASSSAPPRPSRWHQAVAWLCNLMCSPCAGVFHFVWKRVHHSQWAAMLHRAGDEVSEANVDN